MEMKISQLTTERAADVLVEAMAPLCAIIEDGELAAELAAKVNIDKNASKMALWAAVAHKITRLAPLLLKKHREDVFAILAVINGKTVEDIGRQNILVTMAQVREVVKDKELVSFFTSSASSEETE